MTRSYNRLFLYRRCSNDSSHTVKKEKNQRKKCLTTSRISARACVRWFSTVLLLMFNSLEISSTSPSSLLILWFSYVVPAFYLQPVLSVSSQFNFQELSSGAKQMLFSSFSILSQCVYWYSEQNNSQISWKAYPDLNK